MNKILVLNLGCGLRNIPTPYDDTNTYSITRFDIDPTVSPDYLGDARDRRNFWGDYYDIVYCSHNLEHYTPKDGYEVLKNIYYTLKPNGCAHIRVPSVEWVVEDMMKNKRDITDVAYTLENGLEITYHDMIYGYAGEINSGNPHFIHKTGYTPKLLANILAEVGFNYVVRSLGHPSEIEVYAYKEVPPNAR
jgi:SAM-dependent methyltransferase